MITSYPLAWPANKPRNNIYQRSKFKTTHTEALKFVFAEVKRMGGSHCVISTNIPLRQDGMPYSNYKTPDDRGVAVYFMHCGKQMCFACDRWDIIHDNIYAIGKTIEAIRGIERWGSGDMVHSAFSGFTALPSPPSCWDALGVPADATEEQILTAYRARARQAHPDVGGSDNAMATLNHARDQALAQARARCL